VIQTEGDSGGCKQMPVENLALVRTSGLGPNSKWAEFFGRYVKKLNPAINRKIGFIGGVIGDKVFPGQGSSSQPPSGLVPSVSGAGTSGSRSEERGQTEGYLTPRLR
jgi:hypothetical protein